MTGVRVLGAVLGVLGLAAFGVAADPPSAAAASTERSGSVVVQTVPSLAGVVVQLDGFSAVTGKSGQATFSAVPLEDAATRVGVKTQVVSDGTRISLYRVAIDSNHPSLQRRLLLELSEAKRVRISVVTPDGRRIAPSRITGLSMTDNLGRTLNLSGRQLAGPVWLEALVPALGKGGIYGRLVTYALQSVVVRGSNVVNQGQWRLLPLSTPKWVIHGLFFDLSVRATDALAGSPAGTSVKLVFPDRSEQTLRIGPLHGARFLDIPRGEYTVVVEGGVMNLRAPLHLSRNQELSEKVVTSGDAALVVFVVGGGAALAYLFGTHRRRTGALPTARG